MTLKLSSFNFLKKFFGELRDSYKPSFETNLNLESYEFLMACKYFEISTQLFLANVTYCSEDSYVTKFVHIILQTYIFLLLNKSKLINEISLTINHTVFVCV